MVRHRFLYVWCLMINPFKQLNKIDWIIYIISLTLVVSSNFFARQINVLNLICTTLGVTSLIFIAKGKVFGQVLMVVFGSLYSIVAIEQRYYSEIITYLGMTVPISILSIVTWVKNPYGKEDKVVKIRRLTLRELLFSLFFTACVTMVFYFVLREFKTANLLVSTISISTSFFSSYLMMRRISIYAIGFTLNDIVLMILWSFASVKDLSYLSMVACFSAFLINDLYGFVKWTKREKEQEKV